MDTANESDNQYVSAIIYVGWPNGRSANVKAVLFLTNHRIAIAGVIRCLYGISVHNTKGNTGSLPLIVNDLVTCHFRRIKDDDHGIKFFSASINYAGGGTFPFPGFLLFLTAYGNQNDKG